MEEALLHEDASSIFELCGVDDFEDCTEETDDEEAEPQATTLLGSDVVLIDGLPGNITDQLNDYFGKKPEPPFKLDLTDRVDLSKKILALCYGAQEGVEWEDEWLARIRLNQYHTGGRFEWHQDQSVKTILPSEAEGSSVGVRTARNTTNTVLVYLSDCEKGGQTEFIIRKGAADAISQKGGIHVDSLPITSGSKSFDKIRIQPRVGRCVIFDHNVRHQALPAADTKRIAQFKFHHPEKVHSDRDKLSLLDANVAFVNLHGSPAQGIAS